MADIAATQARFYETLAWPETQARIAALFRNGLQQRGDFELHLGRHLAEDY